jgi:hypothetical protein
MRFVLEREEKTKKKKIKRIITEAARHRQQWKSSRTGNGPLCCAVPE